MGLKVDQGNYWGYISKASIKKIIPPYQRSYVWKNERIDNLWDDIKDSSSRNKLFIGTTIQVAIKDGEHEIVDGQQRLITFIILRSAMRDFIKVIYNAIHDLVPNDILIDVSDVITEFKCIGLIMPPEDLAEFFNKHILLDKKKARQTERYPVKEMLETRKSNTSKTAEKNLIDNYISFFEKILIQFHENSNKDLVTLFDYKESKKYLEEIKLDKSSQGYYSAFRKDLGDIIKDTVKKNDPKIKNSTKKLSQNVPAKKLVKKKIDRVIKDFFTEVESQISLVANLILHAESAIDNEGDIDKFIKDICQVRCLEPEQEDMNEIQDFANALNSYFNIHLDISISKKKVDKLQEDSKKYRSSSTDRLLKTGYESYLISSEEESVQQGYKGFVDRHLQDLKEKIKKDQETEKERKKILNSTLKSLSIQTHVYESCLKLEKAFSKLLCIDKLEEKINNFKTNQLDSIARSVAERAQADMNELNKKLDDIEYVGISLYGQGADIKALEIFETVNHGGEKLNSSDLLKNLLCKEIFKISRDEATKAAKAWDNALKEVQDEVPSFSATEFLRYYWASKYSSETEKTIFPAIKQELTEPKQWQDFLEEFVRCTQHYIQIVDGNSGTIESYIKKSISIDAKRYRFDEAINESIFILKNSGNKIWHQFFIAIFNNLKDIIVSLEGSSSKPRQNFKKQIKEFAELTYIFTNYTEEKSNTYQGILSKHVPDFNELRGIDLNNKIEKINTALNDRIFSRWNPDKIDTYFNSKLKYSNNELAKKRIKCHLFLIEKLSYPQKPRETFNRFSIEHIVPKSGRPWGLTKKDVSKFKDSIGNLLMLEKDVNSVKDNTWKESLKVYEQDSLFRYTKGFPKLVEEKEWDFEDIKDGESSGVNAKFQHEVDLIKQWINEKKKSS